MVRFNTARFYHNELDNALDAFVSGDIVSADAMSRCLIDQDICPEIVRAHAWHLWGVCTLNHSLRIARMRSCLASLDKCDQNEQVARVREKTNWMLQDAEQRLRSGTPLDDIDLASLKKSKKEEEKKDPDKMSWSNTSADFTSNTTQASTLLPPISFQTNAKAIDAVMSKANIEVRSTVCSFWPLGPCQKGSTCSSIHEGPAPEDVKGQGKPAQLSPSKSGICGFFKRDRCRFGDNCSSPHEVAAQDVDMVNTTTAPNSPKKKHSPKKKSVSPRKKSSSPQKKGYQINETCHFWQQDVCGKGGECRFLHE